MIKVSDLQFTYPGTTQAAVKGISFEVREGEILGFLGPSGAGKSTTQKILIGLLKGYAGSVQVLGRERQTWGQDFYEHVGVSFELPNHYLKLTALENLNYFSSLYQGSKEDPNHLLEMVGLADSADLVVGQFSKGMKMRLNFARSLLHKPRLLFLDEPTSGLDPVNARIVKDIVLQKRAQGTTVFLTTHDMWVADELSDRVAFMVDGAIKLVDTPKALKLAHGKRQVRIEYGQNGTHGEAVFPLEQLGYNREFLELLCNQPVETIHSEETTLEKIFIQVTGKELV